MGLYDYIIAILR